MLRDPSALYLENPFNDVELDDGLRLAPYRGAQQRRGHSYKKGTMTQKLAKTWD